MQFNLFKFKCKRCKKIFKIKAELISHEADHKEIDERVKKIKARLHLN